MRTITGFQPIAVPSAHTLVLGSMPGVLSLKANQYYAHPRNAFWSIMASICGFSPELPYLHRVEQLQAADIALWDVLHTCVRPGSLDSAIEEGSRVPNDFAAFFQQHPHIRLVGFNGAEAEKSFNAYILPQLNVSGIHFVRLPSTSPAHAALTLAQKITAWREALCIKP
ncbi:G:T/U mismatch-specific DNA glycosylase [Methylophilaceae bacterium 11]|nr:G:T/U mismatch-specific DNA glycosylase [Methylophilaceae bacterium 11]